MTDVDEIDRWVRPFYLNILHANYVFQAPGSLDQQEFVANAQRALCDFTPAIGLRLINNGWREAITGSWLAGLRRLPECQSAIGEALLASRYCYAGQSHAFAMACYANAMSVDYLTRYLQIYLPRFDCYFDQNWAMAALLWIDEQHDSHHAATYLTDDGLWLQFVADKDVEVWSLTEFKLRFWIIMDFCNQHFASTT